MKYKLRLFFCLFACLVLSALAAEKTRFTDVTAASGLKTVGRGHGVAIEDFDNDGDLDIVMGGFDPPYVQMWRNEGNLRFKNVTEQTGLSGISGAVSGITAGDYDNDGNTDLYFCMLREGASRLFRNKGKMQFEDVSRASGTLITYTARNAAFADFNRDGWLDLYVTSPNGANELLRNNRDGTFTDVAAKLGVDLPNNVSLGCSFADLNGDGYPELVVANYKSQQNKLFENRGGVFSDVTRKAGLTMSASHVGCVFGDVDNDGRLDLYITTDSWLSGIKLDERHLVEKGHTVEPNQLYLNIRRGTKGFAFAPVDEPVLWLKTLCHDAIIADLDNDGQQEIYVGLDAGQPKFVSSPGGNRLFRLNKIGRWVESAKQWGIDHKANTVCVPAADFDNDGDLDLLIVNYYSDCVLYENNTDDGNWLRVRCQGTKSNRSGIGAQVRVTDPKGRLLGMREIVSGGGYCSSRPLEAHFGLGKVKKVNVEVVFPSGRKRVIKDVAAGKRLLVREGK